jgi:hypothetical protein
MLTEYTTLGFGSGAVSAFVLVWFVMWTMERAADQNQSVWPGIAFTIALGVGTIALHYHAATAWVDWASASEESTAFVTSTLGVLIGGLFGILLLEPQSAEEPPYVAVRTVPSDDGNGGSPGAGGDSPPSSAGAGQFDSDIDSGDFDEAVKSLVDDPGDETPFSRSDDPGDETPFSRSDEPRPSPAGENRGD